MKQYSETIESLKAIKADWLAVQSTLTYGTTVQYRMSADITVIQMAIDALSRHEAVNETDH